MKIVAILDVDENDFFSEDRNDDLIIYDFLGYMEYPKENEKVIVEPNKFYVTF